MDTLSAIDMSALDQRAEAAALLLKSLANPVRLKMLCAMIEGEQSVGAIARRVGVRETVVSQHLMRLRAEGIVSYRRQGTTVFYRLVAGPAQRVLVTLHDVFCKP
ncbi:ArsR/SmtB family transcription factor [Elioraea tepida]|uniref:ArsR/SmtB family transcription factor n=1 Tax=Elioraea tepida TaxID=2843330 RepID=UPI001F1F6701|nr:metalloregulator ArsR/SmtB family transcription factor [Elioraea tepida]